MMKWRAGDFERDRESGLLVPRHGRRGGPRAMPQYVGPTFFAAAAAPATDPYFANVVALLHADDTSGAVWTDSSSYARQVLSTPFYFKDLSTNGIAIADSGRGCILSTAQTKFGNASISFDGTNFLTTASNAALSFGTGDFTIELHAYSNVALSTQRNLYSFSTGATADGLSVNSSGKVVFWKDGIGALLTSTTTISASTWYHVAVARVGTSLKLFINGTQEASATNSSSFTAQPCYIGHGNFNSNWNGYIANLRVTTGVGRYTASFTAPSSLYPTNSTGDTNWTSVALLLDGQLQGVNSTTAKYGAGAIQGYTDTRQVSAYAAKSTDFAFGTGDFTVEAWIDPIATGGQFFISITDEGQGISGSLYTGMQIGMSIDAFTCETQAGSTTGSRLVGGSIASTGVYYHVAASRASGTLRLFMNGTQQASAADSINLSASASLIVGTDRLVVSSFPSGGKFDEIRVTKGVGRYTANFTAPTSAFPNS